MFMVGRKTCGSVPVQALFGVRADPSDRRRGMVVVEHTGADTALIAAPPLRSRDPRADFSGRIVAERSEKISVKVDEYTVQAM
jgi:hypothetical protein